MAKADANPPNSLRKTNGEIAEDEGPAFGIALLCRDKLALGRAAYCGVPCQTRIDWFSCEYGIVDLKTCDSLKWFEGDCKRFAYAF